MVDFEKMLNERKNRRMNKMTNENIYDNIPNSLEDLDTEARDFINWQEASKHQIEFEDNEVRTGTNKYGRTAYYYNVIEAGVKKVLSVTSVKLMILLKGILPLAGLTVSIERTGTGYDTDYILIVIK